MSANTDVADGGDFVDSDDEFERVLYYPICIGETLADQYRIEHKLGCGGFSTVWMAYDIQGKKDVALKIMTSEDSNEHEYKIQTEIARDTQDIPILYSIKTHCSSADLTAITGMSAEEQLLQAISHLHDIGIVHRDLSSANVMYNLRPIDSSSVAAKYEYIGHPKKLRLDPYLWKTGELVMPMRAQESLIGDDVSLGDFGLAIKSGTPVSQKLQSTAIYCAPERVHDQDPTFATGMWSYMCIFAELYMGYALLYGSGNSSIISCMVNALGPLPATWKGTYKAGGASNDWWYDQGYELDPTASLEAKVARLRPDINAEEKELVLSVLRKGLSYQPQDRLSASQLLEDASFKVLMKIYGLKNRTY
ncbi:kinase domain-containing protein [Fusarium oxysporum]|nr:kinase domain-containing protein [Fusarium oxysporum]